MGGGEGRIEFSVGGKRIDVRRSDLVQRIKLRKVKGHGAE